VLSVVLTQDAFFAQRYLHPQLLPVRDDGVLKRPATSSSGSSNSSSGNGGGSNSTNNNNNSTSNSTSNSNSSSSSMSVSTLTVEPRLLPPSRSGLAWSMLSDGAPLFLLDAGDEIILYKYVCCAVLCYCVVLLCCAIVLCYWDGMGWVVLCCGILCYANTNHNASVSLSVYLCLSLPPRMYLCICLPLSEILRCPARPPSTQGPAPAPAETLVGNPRWLVNDINRRISVSHLVPRFRYI
jgi:hypothetical protein